jgi:hypothetical protein
MHPLPEPPELARQRSKNVQKRAKNASKTSFLRPKRALLSHFSRTSKARRRLRYTEKARELRDVALGIVDRLTLWCVGMMLEVAIRVLRVVRPRSAGNREEH